MGVKPRNKKTFNAKTWFVVRGSWYVDTLRYAVEATILELCRAATLGL